MRRSTTVTSLARHSNVARRTLTTHHGASSPPVQITTLPNKLRVATESTPGHFSSVGLYVDAGSRYETPPMLGVSHFLDRMAFKSTHTRTDEEMSAAIDKLGGQILGSSARESIMYQSSHFHAATPLAVALIADTALAPALLPAELAAQRDAARYEIREIKAKPEMFLPEVLHEVAYGGSGLGNSLMCPEERIDRIDGELLRETMRAWYRPERMVLAGAGMHHQELIELADKYFSSLKASPAASIPQPRQPGPSPSQSVPPHLLQSTPQNAYKSFTRAASSYLYPQAPDAPLRLDASASATAGPGGYTGGHRFLPDAKAEFDHLYVAYAGVGIHDDAVYALAVMQTLLGGGGSFSAGGPGKGMYSRLYTHVLNHFPQIDHCAAFHHIYADSSLFGLSASFAPAGAGGGHTPAQVLPHLVHQLALLLHRPVPADELARARNQLKSSLVMALESRSVAVEDLGRQVLVHARKVPVTEMLDKIDAVAPEDIVRVAGRLWGPEARARPTVVGMGRKALGDWEGVFSKYGVAV